VTIEVQDIRGIRVLAAKLRSRQAAVAEQTPKQSLGIGFVAAELAGKSEQVGGEFGVGFCRQWTLTPTLSQREREGVAAPPPALHLGADGLEVHEPHLEEGLGHRLQRLAHPPVQLDLVVQRAEDVGNGALFWKGR
jgi:hypothetical protein